MATLATLPPEILSLIISNLELSDVSTLSPTSKAIFSHCTSRLFNKICCTSENTPDEAFLKRHGHLIHNLIFDAIANIVADYANDSLGTDCYRKVDKSKKDLTPPLSQAARDLLSGQSAPNLSAITLSFEEFKWDPEEDGQEGETEFLEDPRNKDEDVVDSEKRHRWRGIMRDVWLSVAQNKKLTYFGVVEMIPRRCSAFENDGFKQMLGRLTGFGMDPVSGTKSDSCGIKSGPGFAKFEQGLGELIYKHLENVEYLHIGTLPDSCLGGDCGRMLRPHAFKPEYCPKLKVFEMWSCLVDEKLAEFLVARKDTLEKIVFDDVKASNRILQREGMRMNGWESFLRQLADGHMKALVEVTMRDDSGGNECSSHHVDEVDEEYELEDESCNKVFSHGYVDEYFFVHRDDGDEYLDNWRKRIEPQWRRLVKVVVGNRKRMEEEQ